MAVTAPGPPVTAEAFVIAAGTSRGGLLAR